MGSYKDAFIQVAPDCPAEIAIVPTPKRGARTVASTEYELLSDSPYRYTQDDLIFAVHVLRHGISADELALRGAEIRAELFRKPHPCMRASPLPKQYGWGVHYDGEGRIAIYGRESPEYRAFVAGEGGAPRVLTAMRSKRD
jgi:hypothetical protein